MTTAVVLVLCLVFASSNGHLFAEPGGIPPTSLSLTKIFDDFVYAITSKNVTAIASMIQDDCSALMTDQNCAIIKQQDDGGAAVLKAIVKSFDVFEVESVVRKYSIVSNSSISVWAEVSGFTTQMAQEKMGLPWHIFYPNVFFNVYVNPLTGQIVQFLKFVPDALVVSGSMHQAQIEAIMNAIVGKNASKFASELSPMVEYTGFPEGNRYAMDQYNFTTLVEKVTSRFSITQRDKIYMNLIYATCNWVIADVTQLSKFVPSSTESVTIMEKSMNGFLFVDVPSSQVGTWVRSYWNNITQWST